LFEIVIVVEVDGAVHAVEPEPIVGVPGFEEPLPPQATAAASRAADAAQIRRDRRILGLQSVLGQIV
jgi:hypothetical protein